MSPQASAQGGPSGYLQSEREIQVHDRQLSSLADHLENWLSGRSRREHLLDSLRQTRRELPAYRRLPSEVAGAVREKELAIVEAIEVFSRRAEPDAEGQRDLLLALSRLSQERTVELLRWRGRRLGELLAQKLPQELHQYLRWEAAWVSLWLSEASLTEQLQRGFLDPEASVDGKGVLREILRLRLKADHTVSPPGLSRLDALAKERLTVLARTAEQLLRLEERKSQGAVTRVRRLSRRLASLTESYQAERLERLADLIR